MHLLLPNTANSDLLRSSSLITANSNLCGKNATNNDLSLQSVYIAAGNNYSLPTILITTSNKLNTTAVVSRSIPLLSSSATTVYIAVPSSPYCNRNLAATNATCSHEVTPQLQLTLLLPSSSSAIAAF
ncbi:hypothetical protein B296_00010919 [Ensete ventricosum]|uniref:Uncharacterized protein n=1 Tax=Ensete ventricosum TaxID=4639 RepID=A0A426XX48_ENSVE|nr:hypothetical protein B296_00010919 [Ensete ventricosum]